MSLSPHIRTLPDPLISQIAAGEVVERPANVIKELVENALDARASRIVVTTEQGGKNYMAVVDNGTGMSAKDLELAVRRHTTSKLPDDHLYNIHSFGFRGEALASVGSVARLCITSRQQGAKTGHQIKVEGGIASSVTPQAANQGTKIDVRDLFHATPARLKFLKSDRAEAQAINQVMKRLALAHADVHFTLDGSDRQPLYWPAQCDVEGRMARVRTIVGHEFADSALELDRQKPGMHLYGYAGLPTLNRANSLGQYFFVNGRPVQDRLFSMAVRAAYADVIQRGRYPMAVLFLDIDPEMVDVNVHPAKSEVRFQDPGHVRGLVIKTIQTALTEASPRTGANVASATLKAFKPETARPVLAAGFEALKFSGADFAPTARAPMHETAALSVQTGFKDVAEHKSGAHDETVAAPCGVDTLHTLENLAQHPLGAAIGQIHENYILAQSQEGLVLVDQHAAHERLVYERLKAQLHKGRVAGQHLLIPDIVRLNEEAQGALLENREELAQLGLEIEAFGAQEIAVNQTPALLGEVVCTQLLNDIADEILSHEKSDILQRRLDAIASRMACHGSVRSGRRLKIEEMNQLLRDIEHTPLASQCNHGRPTFISLSLKDIERLFGRTV